MKLIVWFLATLKQTSVSSDIIDKIMALSPYATSNNMQINIYPKKYT